MANPLAPISVNQQKQYGDQKILDTAKAVKPGAVSGAMMPARKAGRPVQSGQQPQAQGQGTQSADLNPAHIEAIQKLPIYERAARNLAAAAQRPDAGPFTRFYAELAQRQYEEMAMDFRRNSPFFED